MTSNKGSEIPAVLPKTQRAADGMREREAARAAEVAEAEAEAEALRARLEAEAESGLSVDLASYLRQTEKEKMTFNLSADICETIRDHSRPLRMSHSEIVERGVRMFFRSELIKVRGLEVE